MPHQEDENSDERWQGVQRGLVLVDIAVLKRNVLDNERRIGTLEVRAQEHYETHRQYVTEEKWEDRHQEIERALSDLQLWRANLTGRLIGAGAVAGAIGGVVVWLVELILRKL